MTQPPTEPRVSDFDIAVQRLTKLANNPKTPATVAGDLALVLLAAKDSVAARDESAARDDGTLIQQLVDAKARIEELKRENQKLRINLVAWNEWYRSIVADFRGVTDDAEDSTRMHDWDWIEQHRPPPETFEYAALAPTKKDAKP